MMMNKYEEFRTEYDRFLASLPAAADRKAAEAYVFASIFRIWGSNVLYSPDYAELFSYLSSGSYTAAQIVTAMGCCGDSERELLVPDFFRDLVESDVKDHTEKAVTAINKLSSLLTAAALINGDFTLEEAECQSEITGSLVRYAKDRGLGAYNLTDPRSKITEKNAESYLRNDELLRAVSQKKESIKSVTDTTEDNEDGGMTVRLSLDLSGGSDLYMDKINAELSSDNEPRPAAFGGSDDEETMESLLKELDSLVGLDSVKKDVHSLMNLIKVVKIRQQRGMKVPMISYHLVFTGNPGTGKTTVARLVAKLYYQMGILSQGQLVETDRSMLVADLEQADITLHELPQLTEQDERTLRGMYWRNA